MLHQIRRILIMGLLGTVAACSNTESDETDPGEVSGAPAPRYAQRDGETYMYIAALSSRVGAEAQTPDIFNIRYLGTKSGSYQLESVDDNGARLALFECAAPCRIVKRTINGTLSKEAVLSGSLLEAAILDASNGLLVESSSVPAERSIVATAPTPSETEGRNSAPSNRFPPILSGKWSTYSSKIREGWNTEPTFGNRYVIIRLGCGTGCTFNMVGDHHTGRIYDLGLGGEEMQMLDLQFGDRSYSIRAQWEDFESDSCVRQNYIWKGSELSPIGEKVMLARPDGGCPSIA